MSSVPSDPVALIRQLQAQGDPASLSTAAELQQLHYERQMAGVSEDVYQAAKGVGEPGPGWTRASEDPQQLESIARQLGTDAKQLKALMQPTDSGFRAEIYLPDPAVLGPGFKPVLVFKGSTGEILDPNAPGGRRESATEDFLANNFPQSIGLESDYYTRAMLLATLLKENGYAFDLAGHSLAGGMASAASVVTGARATTYNAAGLHPETVARFARENPGTQLHDPQQTVTAYQVRGEVLNDGLQLNIDRLDAYRRNMLAGTLRDTAFLLRESPLLKDRVEQALLPGMPEKAQNATRAFLDTLARGDAKAMLRDLPLAAGTVKPLAMPMMRQHPDNPDSPLVPRPEVMDMDDLTRLATPTLWAARNVLGAGRAGHHVGELAVQGGQLADHMLEGAGMVAGLKGVAQGHLQHAAIQSAGVVTGALVQTQSALVQVARKAVGEGHARLVEGAVAVESMFQRASGRTLEAASRWVPNVFGARDWMAHKAERMHAHADKVEQAGQRHAGHIRMAARTDAVAVRDAVDIVTLETVTVTAKLADTARDDQLTRSRHTRQGLDEVGDAIARLGQVGQAGLTVTAGGVMAALHSGQLPILGNARTVSQHGAPAATEATHRHAMGETVIPSLDTQMQPLLDKAQRQLHVAPQQPAPAGVAPDAQAVRHGFPVQDQAVYDRIRREVPAHLSDDLVAHAVVQVRRSDMLDTGGGIARIGVQGDRLLIGSHVPGFNVMLDARQSVPGYEQSVQHAQALAQMHERQQHAAAPERTLQTPVMV